MCDADEKCLRKLVAERDGVDAGVLARAGGVRRHTVYAWLAGGIVPRRADALAAVLGVDAGRLARCCEVDPCPAPGRATERVDTAASAALRAAMDHAGLGADALARAAGVGRTTVFSILSDGKRPGAATLYKLAGALGVDPVSFARDCGEVADHPADEARLRLGLSRGVFAERVGVSTTVLYSGSPMPHHASRIALALGGGTVDARRAADEAREAHELHRASCDLGDLIDDWAAREGVSPSEFARRVGVSRQAVAQWRQGLSLPSAASAARAEQVLGVASGSIDCRSQPARAEPVTELGVLIDRHSSSAGVTLTQVAHAVGVRPAVVSAWRMGAGRPSPDARLRLAAALAVPVAEVERAVDASGPRWVAEGEALRRRRRAARLRVSQLAARWGVTATSVRKMEAGWQRPRPW